MMSEQVEPDTFEPPCHKLKPNIKAKLAALLKSMNHNLHEIKLLLEQQPLQKCP